MWTKWPTPARQRSPLELRNGGRTLTSPALLKRLTESMPICKGKWGNELTVTQWQGLATSISDCWVPVGLPVASLEQAWLKFPLSGDSKLVPAYPMWWGLTSDTTQWVQWSPWAPLSWEAFVWSLEEGRVLSMGYITANWMTDWIWWAMSDKRDALC